MKKLLPYAPIFALLLGAVSMSLRFWMLSGGTDDQGLYPAGHPAWILVCLLCVCSVCLFFIMSHRTERRRTYRDNFPASVPAAAGNLAAALGIAVSSIGRWESSALIGIFGLLCSGLLVYSGLLRLQGRKRPFLIPAALCLFLALQVFSMGRLLGAEPQLSRFLFPFLAVGALLPACYHQWGFDVNSGDRCKSLFWQLTGGYLCLAAVPGSNAWPLYLGAGLWLLTDVCSLQPIRRNAARPTAEEASEAEAPEDALAEAAALSADSALLPEDVDTDTLIADILKDLEEN